jgi:uncharacterized protein (TIGR02147 family)
VAFGPRAIEKLGKVLLLDIDDIEEFKEEARARRRARRGTELPELTRAATGDYRPVQTDVFRVVSDWHHFAILELMQLESFDPEPSKIASQLGVSTIEVSLAIERLARVGMIERRRDGSLVDLTGGFSTNIAQPFFDPAHRRMQKQILEKAIRALETVPVARRDQSAITLAFDSSRVQEAKQWIKQFRRKFNAEFGQGEARDSVYHLSISLYPVSEPLTKKRKSRREK